MNDVVLVAIVDALKNLFHQNSSVTLREFTSLENFVEQFSSLANSVKQKWCQSIMVFDGVSYRQTYSVTR